MKRMVVCFIFLLSLLRPGSAQVSPSEKLGFRRFQLDLPVWGEVDYYVSTKKLDSTKPLLLYLDGSGPFPLYQKLEKGFGSSVMLDVKKLAEHYHIVLISKPGIPFVDSLAFNKELGYPEYQEPAEYTQKLSLDWRVQTADAVLNEVIQKFKVDRKKICIMGISEGFQVGAKLATVNLNITHLMLFVGNGLNQFFDFIIQARMASSNGMETDSTQKVVDSLFHAFAEINADPGNTTKQWYGHSYLRWSSFCNNIPLENIVSLNIPVYIVACSNDQNSAILGTDYLYLECLRLKKNNVTYKVYPFDHSFNEFQIDANGKRYPVKNHMRMVIDEALVWLANWK